MIYRQVVTHEPHKLNLIKTLVIHSSLASLSVHSNTFPHFLSFSLCIFVSYS